MNILSMNLFVLILFIGLSGCAAAPFLERLVEKPKLEVTNFSMSEANFLKQTFTVKLKVENPNNFSLPILGLHYNLAIAGVHVAEGSHTKSITIPASGSDFIDIDVNTNILKTLPNLKSVLMKSGQDITYSMTGHAKTGSALITSIPFKKSGVFKFKF